MAAANTPIKVLTMDDHPLLREGIAALLEGHGDQDQEVVQSVAHGLSD